MLKGKMDLNSFVVKAPQNIAIENIPLPEIGDRDVLVRVAACGICGTDRHIYHGHYPANYPVVIGHEFSGRVERAGREVREVTPGDKVSIDPNILCGTCSSCREGHPNLCRNMVALGVDLNGGLSPYCRVPVSQIYKLPPEADLADASLVEPLSCVLHGVDLLGVKAGTRVVIFGGGFIGQLMAQIIRLQGAARVVLVDPNEDKRAIARSLGFDTINSRDLRQLESLAEFDASVDCAGAGKVLQQCIEITRPGGKILMFAAYGQGQEVAVTPYDIFRKQLQLIGSFTYPDTQSRAIRLLTSGKIVLDPLVTRIRLDEVVSLFTGERKLIKGVVVFP
ncbi:sorbitol dehydrogenase [Desulfocucumis palustris]|uniref:Sorbitol dehydrogenase n=2 Tax=Desulfocucumis palustris TaxID=1898651 RepID=A0A2L2XDF3_9FIRM|nr:sorbitol dehydrogenase [Desulfocucumis palustris]